MYGANDQDDCVQQKQNISEVQHNDYEISCTVLHVDYNKMHRFVPTGLQLLNWTVWDWMDQLGCGG